MSARRWVRSAVLAASLAMAALAGTPALASTPAAVFDAGSMQLTLPQLRLDAGVRATNVVLSFVNFGQVRTGDPAVGSQIEFVSQTNVLRIPVLRLGGIEYTGVSLTGPVVRLVSYGPLEIDSPVPGNHTLVLSLSVSGNNLGEVARLLNVPKPSTQAQFCDDARLQELRNTITQQSGNMVGTLTLKSCSFDGTRGQIAMEMGIQSPYPGLPSLNIPYVATYVYQ